MNNEILEKIQEYELFFSPSISSGFNSLKDKIIELSVAETVDTTLVCEDPAGIENYIRYELARKIANQLIEEDLIQIQPDEDVEFKNTTFRARVKVIQE